MPCILACESLLLFLSCRPPLCLPLYPIRVKFNVKGPRGQGEVYAEITSENAKSEYTRNMTEEYDTQKHDTHCRTLAALTDMECPPLSFSHFLPTWPHFTTARPLQDIHAIARWRKSHSMETWVGPNPQSPPSPLYPHSIFPFRIVYYSESRIMQMRCRTLSSTPSSVAWPRWH